MENNNETPKFYLKLSLRMLLKSVVCLVKCLWYLLKILFIGVKKLSCMLAGWFLILWKHILSGCSGMREKLKMFASSHPFVLPIVVFLGWFLFYMINVGSARALCNNYSKRANMDAEHIYRLQNDSVALRLVRDRVPDTVRKIKYVKIYTQREIKQDSL